MATEADVIESALIDLVQSPARVKTEVGEVDAQDPSKLIEAAKFVAANNAAANPLKFFQFKHRGTQG